MGHDASRDRLNVELAERRKAYLEQMKKHNEERMRAENEILRTGLRMQTVKMENDKFVDAIRRFEADFNGFKEIEMETDQDVDAFRREYLKLHRNLIYNRVILVFIYHKLIK